MEFQFKQALAALREQDVIVGDQNPAVSSGVSKVDQVIFVRLTLSTGVSSHVLLPISQILSDECHSTLSNSPEDHANSGAWIRAWQAERESRWGAFHARSRLRLPGPGEP